MEYNEDSEKTEGETNKQTNKQTNKTYFLSLRRFWIQRSSDEYNEDNEKIGGETNQQTTKENLASFAQKVFDVLKYSYQAMEYNEDSEKIGGENVLNMNVLYLPDAVRRPLVF